MLPLTLTSTKDTEPVVDGKIDVSSQRVGSGDTEATTDSYEEDAPLSCPSSTGSQCSRVKFADDVQVHRGLGRHQYSRGERKACWYSQQDLSKSSLDRTKVVACLANGDTCSKSRPDEEMTLRGLEPWTESGAQQLSTLNRQVTSVVLYEQLRQRILKLQDPEMLATKYQAVTKWSTMKALDLAKTDEQEAQAIARLEVKAGPPKRRSLLGRDSLRLFQVLQRDR